MFGWKKAGLLCLCSGALGIVFYLYLHYSTVGSFPLLLTNYKRYLLAVGSTITLGFIVIFMDSLLNRLVEKVFFTPFFDWLRCPYFSGRVTDVFDGKICAECESRRAFKALHIVCHHGFYL